MSPSVVVSALRRNLLFVAATVVLAGATAGAVAALLPLPKMTGFALFQIHATQQYILAASEKNDFNLFRQSQAALVKNRVVLNAALRDTAVRGASVLHGDDKLESLHNRG